MRTNEPVTQRDMGMNNETEIISTTNLKGILTSANDDFIRMSGFTWDELSGKNHNIIRHPDMPPEAYANLWETLKGGKPWMGIVKNRNKCGDHYWVDAFASAQYEDGQVIGYQSVRVKPKQEWVDRAEALYAKIMSKKTDSDKRRSTLSSLKLTRFPLSFTTRVGLSVSSLFIILFTILAAAGQIAWIPALAGAVTGAGVSYATVYTLLSGLRKMAARSEKIANDALTRYIYTGRTDEIGQIEYALIFMNAKLRTAIGRVKESSSVLDHSASEIATGNLYLSERTENQASSLEETASSMEEITSTVQQNADNARQANQLVHDSQRYAEKSGAVVTSAMHAMAEIHDSSKEIAEIINVIDSIAFQTNLLALNAAVEAARAGEQGRGFAVVANEVRNLAGRSADSAKQIKTLINDSVAKVEKGTSLVNESGEALRKITESVKKISSIVAEISESCQEQANGIEQINQAVSQIDETTQQNAALVEESAAASEAMSQKVKLLAGLAYQFKQENAH
ncbi:PAS domain-containing methyl-accepting chemotaxis protein [Nitrosomonas sp. sh817]|uniref:methyl-accepting chemotaxis protein n=1 Tax=Nitrosomonas sp. sh817 TaxID=3070658 RepID=UPI0027DC3914|nr:PAS domain-containing methyl-accepting chemotaxis protein [Nitrosomonas sp. sh817]WMJ07577.1 methyl-accepting chemotaxis protein [Nitrosomonas sp. sh817]